MTTPHSNRDEQAEIDWATAPESARVRACADGELNGDAEALLRASMGSERVDRAIGFERELRARCGACLGGDRAPAGLRDRVVAAVADGAVMRRPGRGFWANGGRAVLGLAAAVALAAGVWVLAPSGGGGPDLLLQQASAHVAAEHAGCSLDTGTFLAKVERSGASENPGSYIAEQIGGLPVHLELGESGYRLAGVGGCHVPGPGKSVHLLYEPVDPSSSRAVSLFIQEAGEAHAKLREGVVYTNGLTEAPYVRIWREGGAVYYMATSCPVSCKKVEAAYALTGKRVPL